MTRLLIAAVVVLAVSATTAAAFQTTLPALTAGIDVNPEGNQPNSLGALDSCFEAAVGDTFDIDIFVRGVPPPHPGEFGTPIDGIAGFSYNLNFDGDILEVQSVANDLMTTVAGPDEPFQVIDADYFGDKDSFPSRSGNVRVDYVDLSALWESGDGVMSRVTVQAIGRGRSGLFLDDYPNTADVPMILAGQAETYPIALVYNAEIAVGEPCGATTPTPHVPQNQTNPPPNTGEPTPTPNNTAPPTPSPIPVGDTSVSIDAIPTGNTTTSLGEIDVCAAAEVGDTFDVDVIVENIDQLLAFTAAVNFDPAVLKVVDASVETFLASSDGSQILDTSGVTPNDTGRYSLGATDTADPLAPESGSGVLGRVAFEAVGEGVSALTMIQEDVTGDGVADSGVLLRNVDSLVGDENADTFYDGPTDGAEIRVGEPCDDETARVVDLGTLEQPTSTANDSNGNGGGDTDGDDGSSPLIFILAGLTALAVIGAAAYYFMKRRANAA